MELLTRQLDKLIEKLEKSKEFKRELESLKSVLPFNKYEFILSTLMANNKISYRDYLDIRESYIDRNLYLPIFEISSPRGFGDTWALGYLMQIEPRFKRPKELDKNAKGEYDLCVKANGRIIKIEVKASRANDKSKPNDPLYQKALSSDTKRNFLMNFQQMKPSCCDVFIWIAVFRDAIKYWVINSDVVQSHGLFTPQHRNKSTESRKKDYQKKDIYEGQIMMDNKNINEFNKFLCASNKLYDFVLKAVKR